MNAVRQEDWSTSFRLLDPKSKERHIRSIAKFIGYHLVMEAWGFEHADPADKLLAQKMARLADRHLPKWRSFIARKPPGRQLDTVTIIRFNQAIRAIAKTFSRVKNPRAMYRDYWLIIRPVVNTARFKLADIMIEGDRAHGRVIWADAARPIPVELVRYRGRWYVVEKKLDSTILFFLKRR